VGAILLLASVYNVVVQVLIISLKNIFFRHSILELRFELRLLRLLRLIRMIGTYVHAFNTSTYSIV